MCGLSFRDHLQSWWFPQLYSSYDRHLDEVKRNGIIYDEDEQGAHSNSESGIKKNSTQRKRKDNPSKSSIQTQKDEYESGLSPLYGSYINNNNSGKLKLGRLSYHKSYVNVLSNNDKHESTRKRNAQMFPKKNMNESANELEIRRVAGIKYTVPKINTENRGRVSASLLVTARVFSLGKLDQIIWIQRFEGRK